MKKSIAAATVGTVALATVLTGCSGSGGTGSGAQSGPVSLTVWTGFTGGDRPGYDQIVKDWNASHKNIQVQMVVQPWDTITQKLPSAWLTGSGPDIAAPSFDPNVIAQYVKTGSVLPVTTGDGDTKVNADQIAPALKDEFTYDGKLYAVPANYATLSLYYNKKAFSAAGIDGPPKTLAEFQTDAKKLTTPGGKQYGLVLADNQTIQMWPILQWLGGGDIVDAKGCSVLQTSANQAALKPWVDLVSKDRISPAGLTGAEADTIFSGGKAAMELNGPWAAAGYKKAGIDLGVAPVPTGTDGKSVTLGSTAPLAISAKTKHPEQAQQFLAYWTSKAVQKKFSLTTGFPSLRTDLSDDAELKADPVVSVFTQQIPNARLYLPKVPKATEVDANGYVPLIGKITRGSDLAAQTAAAGKTIDGLTGCSG